jgi:hypothetical protein
MEYQEECLEKRILVGMLTIMDELRMEDRFYLEAFEIAHKHLNYIAGGVYGSNVVDRKSKNNLQEPKSRANPNHIPNGGNNIPDGWN